MAATADDAAAAAAGPLVGGGKGAACNGCRAEPVQTACWRGRRLDDRALELDFRREIVREHRQLVILIEAFVRDGASVL